MSQTASRAALLHIALQDLRAGKVLLVGRLPSLAAAVRAPDLRALIADEIAAAKAARARLDALGDVAGGPANLWMSGILDDADRDATSHEPGDIRDVALVGALRKAKAAERVSTETALALAAGEAPAMLPALRANHEEETRAYAALHAILEELTGKSTG